MIAAPGQAAEMEKCFGVALAGQNDCAAAENYMGEGGVPHALLAALRADYPLSIHGVGLSISHRSDARVCLADVPAVAPGRPAKETRP